MSLVAQERLVARLVVVCPDRPGIVATVSRFLFAAGANIIDSAQHSTDPTGGTFFMRMEFSLEDPAADIAAFEEAFRAEVGDPFAMEWRFSYSSERRRVAILVSRYDHCLLDLIPGIHDERPVMHDGFSDRLAGPQQHARARSARLDAHGVAVTQHCRRPAKYP